MAHHIRWRIGAGLLVCLLTSGFSATASAAPRPLVVGLDSNPTNLDPRFATDAVSYRLTQILYSSLVRIDDSGKIVPEVAERLESLDDRTWRVTLKKGVRFHDGGELSAEDVKALLDSIRDPATGSPQLSGLELLESVEVVDRYTLRLRLRSAFAPFLANLAIGIPPRRRLADPELARRPIGSGPFRLVRWSQRERLEVEAFPEYFAGRPALDRIIFRVVPDTTVRVLELEQGGLDLAVGSLPPELLPRLSRRGLKILEVDSINSTYLGLNHQDPILRQKAVRQALAHAIDRESIIRHFLGGHAQLATGLLPPHHWAYSGDVRRYPYDPIRAEQLLEQAGLHRNARGVRAHLTYKTPTSEGAMQALPEVIQEMLSRVGIEVSIRSYEWGTFFGDVKKGNFQLFHLTWVGIVDPDHYHYVFHAQSIPPRGANRGRYRNPILDPLLDAGRITTDPGRRQAIYAQVQRLTAEDLPYIFLWHPKQLAVMRETVRGFHLTPAGDFTPLREVSLAP